MNHIPLPPKRRQSANPIESFGPEIMAALLRGGKTEVRIGTTYRQGSVFRRRVHQLRARLRELNHPEYPIAARTKVQLLWGPKAGLPAVPEIRNRNGVTRPVDPDAPSLLVLSPRDSEFTDVLRKAGISTDLSDDPLGPPSGGPDPLTNEGVIGDPLSSFRPKETKE